MNLHFNKIQNDIYGSLVRIQDHAKSNNPLFSLGIASYLIPTTESFYTHLSDIGPNSAAISTTKMCRNGKPSPIGQHIGRKALKTIVKLQIILLTKSHQFFWSQSLCITKDKNRFKSLLNICDFPVSRVKPFETVLFSNY